MPGKTFTVDVNPAVLRWARDSAGLDTATVASRLQQPEVELNAWEAGRKKPNWTALRKLASVYKRPVASLLLPAPPQEPPLPPDFRTLPNAQKTLSPKTRFAIRMARWFLQTANELGPQLGIKAEFAALRARPSHNPETIARRARESLGVSLAEQTEWPDVRRAYNQWRGAVETQGVFVFQFPLPVEEVRGISLYHGGIAGNGLNQIDVPSARVATLQHD